VCLAFLQLNWPGDGVEDYHGKRVLQAAPAWYEKPWHTGTEAALAAGMRCKTTTNKGQNHEHRNPCEVLF
jgi:hypothetical protein